MEVIFLRESQKIHFKFLEEREKVSIKIYFRISKRREKMSVKIRCIILTYISGLSLRKFCLTSCQFQKVCLITNIHFFKQTCFLDLAGDPEIAICPHLLGSLKSLKAADLDRFTRENRAHERGSLRIFLFIYLFLE